MITTITVTLLSALFASAMMLYVSLASPFGPWMEVPLVLSMVFLTRLGFTISRQTMVMATAAGGVAGISAVALAFSFPTLYFAAPDFFNALLAHPFFFIGGLSFFMVLSGVCVMWLTHHNLFLENVRDLPFPIGSLAHDALVQVRTSIAPLMYGIGVVSLGDGGRWLLRIPATFFAFDIVALLWSIGFTAGSFMTTPLIVGGAFQLILQGVHYLFLGHLARDYLMSSFCTGMVIFGALQALRDLMSVVRMSSMHRLIREVQGGGSWGYLLAGAASNILVIWCLHSIGMSLISSVLVVVAVMATTVITARIAGQTGLAPLGRFATMIMVPGLWFFSWDPVSATMVALSIELWGGLAADIMFGRTLAALSSISAHRVSQAQFFGILVGAVTSVSLLWYMGSQGFIGTILAAPRARTRALLLQGLGGFHVWSVLGGAVSAFLLQQRGIKTMLVMTGILAPVRMVAPLIVGGLTHRVIKDSDFWHAFSVGCFFAGTVLALFKIML